MYYILSSKGFIIRGGETAFGIASPLRETIFVSDRAWRIHHP